MSNYFNQQKDFLGAGKDYRGMPAGRDKQLSPTFIKTPSNLHNNQHQSMLSQMPYQPSQYQSARPPYQPSQQPFQQGQCRPVSPRASRVSTSSLLSQQQLSSVQAIKLLPNEIEYLLMYEDKILLTYKQWTEHQKKRIGIEIDCLARETMHAYQDLKLCLEAEVDKKYKDYMEMLATIKEGVGEITRVKDQVTRQYRDEFFSQAAMPFSGLAPSMGGVNPNNTRHPVRSTTPLKKSNITLLRSLQNNVNDLRHYQLINFINQRQKQILLPINEKAKYLYYLSQITENQMWSTSEAMLEVGRVKEVLKNQLNGLREVWGNWIRNFGKAPNGNSNKDEQMMDNFSVFNDQQATKVGFRADNRSKVNSNDTWGQEKGFNYSNNNTDNPSPNNRTRRQGDPKLVDSMDDNQFEQEKSAAFYEPSLRQSPSLSFTLQQTQKNSLGMNNNPSNYNPSQANSPYPSPQLNPAISAHIIPSAQLSPTRQSCISRHSMTNLIQTAQLDPSSILSDPSTLLLCALQIQFGVVGIGCGDGSLIAYSEKGGWKGPYKSHKARICVMALVTLNNRNYSNNNHSSSGNIHQMNNTNNIQLKTYLATGSDHPCNSIIIWESTFQLSVYMKLQGHKAAVTAIVDLRDGDSIASGSYDKTILIHSISRREVLFSLPANEASVAGMVLNCNGQLLTSCGLDKTLTVWSVVREDGVDGGPNTNRSGLAISMTNLNHKNPSSPLRLAQVTTIYSLHNIKTSFLTASLASSLLCPSLVVVGTSDGKIKLLDIQKGHTIKALQVSQKAVVELALVEKEHDIDHPLIIYSVCKQPTLRLIQSSSINNNGGSSSSPNNPQFNHLMLSLPGRMDFGCGVGPKCTFGLSSNKQQLWVLLQGIQGSKGLCGYKWAPAIQNGTADTNAHNEYRGY